jgi:hypothetical protein
LLTDVTAVERVIVVMIEGQWLMRPTGCGGGGSRRCHTSLPPPIPPRPVDNLAEEVSWLITAAAGHGLTRGAALGEHHQARTLCEDTLSGGRIQKALPCAC